MSVDFSHSPALGTGLREDQGMGKSERLKGTSGRESDAANRLAKGSGLGRRGVRGKGESELNGSWEGGSGDPLLMNHKFRRRT